MVPLKDAKVKEALKVVDIEAVVKKQQEADKEAAYKKLFVKDTSKDFKTSIKDFKASLEVYKADMGAAETKYANAEGFKADLEAVITKQQELLEATQNEFSMEKEAAYKKLWAQDNFKAALEVYKTEMEAINKRFAKASEAANKKSESLLVEFLKTQDATLTTGHLLDRYATLANEHFHLQNKYATLEKERDRLQKRVDALAKERAALVKERASLMNEKNTVSIVPSMKRRDSLPNLSPVEHWC